MGWLTSSRSRPSPRRPRPSPGRARQPRRPSTGAPVSEPRPRARPRAPATGMASGCGCAASVEAMTCERAGGGTHTSITYDIWTRQLRSPAMAWYILRLGWCRLRSSSVQTLATQIFRWEGAILRRLVGSFVMALGLTVGSPAMSQAINSFDLNLTTFGPADYRGAGRQVHFSGNAAGSAFIPMANSNDVQSDLFTLLSAWSANLATTQVQIANTNSGYQNHSDTQRAALAAPGPVAGAGLLSLLGLCGMLLARRRKQRFAA